MSESREGRTNEDWVAALEGRGDPAAVPELEVYLRRVLARTPGAGLPPADLDELVQESLTRIVKSLPSFRGDSRFTTWAAGIAVRTAFTELRRRGVRDGRHVPFEDVEAELVEGGRGEPDPGETAELSDLLEALRRAIRTRLTERQRVAILAELRGLPTVEIAARLGTSQNALYKLVHDARKALRRVLAAQGFGLEPPDARPSDAASLLPEVTP